MEFWKNKNVLVTGADGFIGSWLAKALIEKGANVTTIVRDIKRESNIDLLRLNKKINIVNGDIIDYNTVLRTLNEYEIDTCFHLAAQPLVQIAEKNPLSTFDSNIKGTWNILEASRNCNLKRIVIASSDKAYGKQEKLPYDEEQPLLGRNPYDASKVCADVLAQMYFKVYKMPIAITRNANTYGPADMNFSRIIPGTIKSVLNDEIPIIRSDGTPERDYIFIYDIIRAYLVLAENLEREEVRGQAFNFGSGKPIRVSDLFNLIIRLCKKRTRPKVLGEAKNEIDRQYLSIGKAKKILGWEPTYKNRTEKGLEEGLKKTIKWYKDYFSSKNG